MTAPPAPRRRIGFTDVNKRLTQTATILFIIYRKQLCLTKAELCRAWQSRAVPCLAGWEVKKSQVKKSRCRTKEVSGQEVSGEEISGEEVSGEEVSDQTIKVSGDEV